MCADASKDAVVVTHAKQSTSVHQCRGPCVCCCKQKDAVVGVCAKQLTNVTLSKPQSMMSSMCAAAAAGKDAVVGVCSKQSTNVGCQSHNQ
eukprot:317622-Pelagomonas_calceolata.AAC.2